MANLHYSNQVLPLSFREYLSAFDNNSGKSRYKIFLRLYAKYRDIWQLSIIKDNIDDLEVDFVAENKDSKPLSSGSIGWR